MCVMAVADVGAARASSKADCKFSCFQPLQYCREWINTKRWCRKYVFKRCRKESDGTTFCNVHRLRGRWQVSILRTTVQFSIDVSDYPKRALGGYWNLEGIDTSTGSAASIREIEFHFPDFSPAYLLTIRSPGACWLIEFDEVGFFEDRYWEGAAYIAENLDCSGERRFGFDMLAEPLS